jgi:hypothetical protein
MRWIFGVGGILVTLLVIVMLLSAKGGPGDYMVTTLKKGQDARVEAQQLAGQDANGVRAMDSITLDAAGTGSRTTALVVSTIMPGGPMQAHFGLATGDKILEVGQQRIRDIDDPELAKALVLEAYQRRQELVIDRGGAKFKVPGFIPIDADGTIAAPSAAPTAAPAPVAAPTPTADTPAATATPAQQPRPRSSLYDQVNQIPGVQR